MDAAGESASQLLLFSVVFSVIIAVVVSLGNEWLLCYYRYRAMYGRWKTFHVI